MFEYWTLLAQIFAVLALLYIFLAKKYSYWSSRGVVGPKPWPLLGNIAHRIFRRPDVWELDWAKRFGKVYGLYYGVEPVLSIIDNDLIKQVMIKDFHLFINRRVIRPFHQVWNQNIFFLEGEAWKRVRSITTPSFTSGKLRSMYPLMQRCVDKLDTYLDRMAKSKQASSVDVREVFAGFTIDVIASTAFATETNANDDRSKKNPFVVNGLDLFKFEPLRILAILSFPRMLNNLLRVKTMFPDKPFQFVLKLSQQIVKTRKANPSKRNDLVQLMIDAYVYENDLKDNNYNNLAASMDQDEEETQKVTGKPMKRLTEEEIVAQCILFFAAGFETTATTLSFCIYELSKQPDLQERLYNNLHHVFETIEAEPNSNEYYETILTKVPYLDAVVKETLRKYPPLIRLERRVNVDGYKLGGIPLNKEQVVEVPVYAVHHNPEYYPEPELYNPERFMPENKHLLKPYTYLPFGIGPRNCVGMRFAYQEIKMCLAQIMHKYRFERTPETPDVLKFRIGSTMLSVNQIPLHVHAR